jgi:gluconate 5-dehydrogenase
MPEALPPVAPPVAPHVLVVGASSGIGHALAERLAPTARVTAMARRLDRMQPLVAHGVWPMALDVSNTEDIAAAVKSAVAERGKIDALVYCAGLQRIRPLRSSTPAELRQVLAINLEAPLVFASLFASRLLSSDKAVFCAVSSIAARRPEPGIVAYAAAKAGLEALVHGLAREAAPRRAVAVAPGWLDTEMTRGCGQIYGESFQQRLAAASPAGIASVASVVDAICFLISPAAAHITGSTLTIDGGASL